MSYDLGTPHALMQVRLTISSRRSLTMKKLVIVATAALVVMSISMTAFAATKTQIKTQIRVPGTVCVK